MVETTESLRNALCEHLPHAQKQSKLAFYFLRLSRAFENNLKKSVEVGISTKLSMSSVENKYGPFP